MIVIRCSGERAAYSDTVLYRLEWKLIEIHSLTRILLVRAFSLVGTRVPCISHDLETRNFVRRQWILYSNRTYMYECYIEICLFFLISAHWMELRGKKYRDSTI